MHFTEVGRDIFVKEEGRAGIYTKRTALVKGNLSVLRKKEAHSYPMTQQFYSGL